MREIKYKAGYKYQLLETCIHKINLPECPGNEWVFIRNGKLYINRGYAWNGANGPTIDTKNSMRGSLVHDALYQLMELKELHPHYRKAVDRIFYNMLREDGMSWVRAKLWYRSVRLFGG